MLAVTRSAEGASQVRLVATTFEWAEDIDAARAQRAKARAEELLQHAHDPPRAVGGAGPAEPRPHPSGRGGEVESRAIAA